MLPSLNVSSMLVPLPLHFVLSATLLLELCRPHLVKLSLLFFNNISRPKNKVLLSTNIIRGAGKDYFVHLFAVSSLKASHSHHIFTH